MNTDGNSVMGHAPGRPGRVVRGDGNTTVDHHGVIPDWMIEVTAHRGLNHEPSKLAYEMYADAFTDARGRDTLGAQRHLSTWDEFDTIVCDDRITKYVARVGDTIVGLSVMTNDLAAWPLVARDFFDKKLPGREIFYIGFVAVRARSQGVFVSLISRMYDDVIAADGIPAMDFSATNVDTRAMPDRVDLLLRSINPNARHRLLDRQEFHVWDFRPES